MASHTLEAHRVKGSSSHDRVETGSVNISVATFPVCDDVSLSTSDALVIAQEWLAGFSKCLHARDYDTLLEDLFVDDECYWRDHLALDWDFRTLHGADKIKEYLRRGNRGEQLVNVELDTSKPHLAPHAEAIDNKDAIHGVEVFLNFETKIGRGRGVVRLVKQKNHWKAFTLFTTLQELHGHEEPTGLRRPQGVRHGHNPLRKNWAERRKAEQDFEEQEPAVLVLGAGQAGLMIAARLKMLGVPTLVVDKNERVGDNWRQRYHQLVLHDPIWYDAMPYVPFPSHWPVFTPKDKLAEWFECYGKILELNIWTNTTLSNSTWDEASSKWTVEVSKKDNSGSAKTRTFHPRHVILATGHSGKPNFPSHIPGISTFAGDRLCHSSAFSGAPSLQPNTKKRIVIVGCCNSAHDIAQDYHEHGYNVTMVQRSTTCVISAESNVAALSGRYDETTPLSTEEADLLLFADPGAVMKAKQIVTTAEHAVRDAELLEGLRAVGFGLDRGPSDAGLFIKYFQRGGGYYIDVGASSLIALGAIGIKQGCEVAEVLPHGVRFDDGSELEADEIIFATGYLNMRTQAGQIFGEELEAQLGNVWGFDEEGELRTMFRGSGHRGFWFMGGNLALCRYFSRSLALQIKAREEGLWTV